MVEVGNLLAPQVLSRYDQWSPLVMRTWEDGPAVQQDLDHLVIIGVRGEDERWDIGSEISGVAIDRFPALEKMES